MFHDFEKLIDQVHKLHPQFQLEAAQALEKLIEEHAAWHGDGKPELVGSRDGRILERMSEKSAEREELVRRWAQRSRGQ